MVPAAARERNPVHPAIPSTGRQGRGGKSAGSDHVFTRRHSGCGTAGVSEALIASGTEGAIVRDVAEGATMLGPGFDRLAQRPIRTKSS